MDCVKWMVMDSTRFCLSTSSVSKENLLNLRYLQIKSSILERQNRKQSTIASSQRGLLVSHMSHKYVLCQAWPVQFSRLLGFAITKTKREAHITDKALACSSLCSLLWGWESLRGKGMSASLTHCLACCPMSLVSLEVPPMPDSAQVAWPCWGGMVAVTGITLCSKMAYLLRGAGWALLQANEDLRVSWKANINVLVK